MAFVSVDDGVVIRPIPNYGASVAYGSSPSTPVQLLDAISDLRIEAHPLAGQTRELGRSQIPGLIMTGPYFVSADRRGEQVFVPVTSLPSHLRDIAKHGLFLPIFLDEGGDGPVVGQIDKDVVDAWGLIRPHLVAAVGNEDSVLRMVIAGLRFGNIEMAAIGEPPDGMVHRGSILVGPPQEHPSRDHRAAAFLDCRVDVPVAVADWARAGGALHLNSSGLSAYFSAKLLHDLVLEWWRYFQRPDVSHFIPRSPALASIEACAAAGVESGRSRAAPSPFSPEGPCQ